MKEKESQLVSWLYKKFLIFLFLSLAVVTILSYALYAVADRKIKEIQFQKNEVEIHYFIRDIDEIFKNAESIGDQITNNLILSGILAQDFNIRNYSSVVSLKNIRFFQESVLEAYPDVLDIRTYHLKNGICISTTTITTFDPDSLAALQEQGFFSKRHWIDPGMELGFEKQNQNSRLLIPVYGYNQSLDCLIVVEMDNDHIYRQISTDTMDSDMIVGILDAEGRNILSQYLNQSRGFQKEWVRGRDGQRIENSPDGDYLVTEESSKVNGWKYAVAVPERKVTSGIDSVRRLVVGIAVLFCILIIIVLICLANQLILPFKSINEFLYHIENQEQTGEKNQLQVLDYRIRDVVRQLELEKSKNQSMKESLEQNERTLRPYALYKLLFGDFSDKEGMRNRLEQLGMEFSAYCVFVIEFDMEGKESRFELGNTEETREKLLTGAEHILRAFLKDSAFSMEMVPVVRPVSYRIYGVTDLYETAELKTRLQFYQNLLLQYFHCTSMIGIGNPVAEIEEVTKSRENAEKILKYRFILGSGHVFDAHDIEAADNPTYMREVNYGKHYLLEGLKNCNPGEIRKIIQGYLDIMKNSHLFLDYEYGCKDTINVIYEAMLERNVENREIFTKLIQYFSRFEQTFPDLESFITIITKDLEEVLNDNPDSHYSKPVKQALEIIWRDYQKDLSLQDVADALGISPQYLSKLFKEEKGQSFKEYLTSLKMQKARELIESTEFSLQEIAAYVGYNDYKHFSVIFKKHFGMTASAYRKNVRP